jgi:hypothetical protein
MFIELELGLTFFVVIDIYNYCLCQDCQAEGRTDEDEDDGRWVVRDLDAL